MPWHPQTPGVDTANVAPRALAGFPWLIALVITAGFLLATHDPLASRKWEKTTKGEVASLAADEANGRFTRQIGFLLVGAAGVLLLVTGKAARPLEPIALAVFPLAALIVWALASCVWSADFDVTLKRQVVLLCMILAAIGLVRRFELSRLIDITFACTLFVLVIGLAADAMFAHGRYAAGEYRFAGTLHPNHAGINASVLLLCSLYLAHRRADWRLLMLAAFAGAILLLTKSRTAAIAAVCATAVFILLAWPMRMKLALAGVLLIGGLVMAVAVTADLVPGLTQAVLLNRKTSDPTTLTGRTMIWGFAMSHVRDDWGRLLAGFGYGGFWTRQLAESLSRRAHFSLAEGHNAYLDTMLQLGLVGLLFYLCAILATLAIALRAALRGSTAAAFAMALLVFTLVHHVAESAMTAPTFPTLVLWAVMAAAALRQPLDVSTMRTA